MTTHPITLTPSQLAAALAGRLEQVRMPFVGTTEHPGPYNPAYMEVHKNSDGWAKICPWGIVGDRLFCWYPDEAKDGKWCNRLDFDITGIRVERDDAGVWCWVLDVRKVGE